MRERKLFAMAKGFFGRSKNCKSLVVRAAMRSMQHAYIGRKIKPRMFRQGYIQSINGGLSEHGVNYPEFMHGLKKSDILLNRKVLSNLAQTEPFSFKALLSAVDFTHPKYSRRNE